MPAKKSAPSKAKSNATPAKPKVRPAKVLVTAGTKVSAADRAKAESLLAEIARRKQRISEDFYEIGLALRELAKRKMYAALGHASFDALLEERQIVGRTTALRLIQLVSSMSRDEALAYGQEKAAALLEYAKATPELDSPKTLVEGGKLPDGKKVADASVRDLKEAAKAARAKHGTAKRLPPEAKEAATEAKDLHAWLRSRGATRAHVEAVRAKGEYVVRVELPIAISRKLRTA